MSEAFSKRRLVVYPSVVLLTRGHRDTQEEAFPGCDARRAGASTRAGATSTPIPTSATVPATDSGPVPDDVWTYYGTGKTGERGKRAGIPHNPPSPKSTG